MGVRVLNRRRVLVNPIANPRRNPEPQKAIAGPGKYTVKVLHKHFGPDYYADVRTPDGHYVETHGMSSPDYVKSWVEQYVYKGQHGMYDVLPKLQWKPGKIWGEYTTSFTVKRKQNPEGVVRRKMSREEMAETPHAIDKSGRAVLEDGSEYIWDKRFEQWSMWVAPRRANRR